MATRITLSILIALLMLPALTACGAGQVDLSVEMYDFTFSPDTITVPAGSEVNLTLNNTGTLSHEMVIMILGKEATIPFGDDDQPNIYWEQELDHGESTRLSFTAPSEPGEYQIVCGIEGHLEAGMKGTLVVTQ